MSEVNGQLCTCARCGAQIFRKCTGEGERDGGFTRWNNFEPYPEGWGIVSIPGGITRYDCLRVCPKCHALWVKAINEHFLRGTEYYVVQEG